MGLFGQPMKQTENLTHLSLSYAEDYEASGLDLGGIDLLTHLSYAFVRPRYLGVGLSGQTMNHTEKLLPRLSLTFAKCLNYARCFYTLSYPEVLTHLSHPLVHPRYLGMGLSGESMNHTGKLLPRLSLTLASLRSTTLILYGHHHQRTLEFAIFLEISRDIISIVSIVFVLMRCLHSRLYRNSMSRRRTYSGSHIWSRRKFFWRQAGVSRESYVAYAFKSRYCGNLKYTGLQEKMYHCSEPPQESEDPLCQDMGPEYSSDEASDGPSSSEEYVPLDRKAKRRLVQRKSDRKRRKKTNEAQIARRNSNPTVREMHNASAHIARDTNPLKRASDSRLERLARDGDQERKDRHNASMNIARDLKRARNPELGQLPREYDLWSSDALPDDDLLKQFELHPYVAAAAFCMMAGVPRDTRICPTDMSFDVDVRNMIDRLKAEVVMMYIFVYVELAMNEIL